MRTFIGIDTGTSGTKALLLGEDGTVLARATAEYSLSSPAPGWSEQSPEEWWRAAEQCLETLSKQYTGPVSGIGLTGQMHGAVFLDEHGTVVRPAILWNDQRTVQECAEIDAAVGPERVRTITRNPPLTGFQLPKILWLRKHEPEAFARVRRVLLPKDYIRFRLTGTQVADLSDASGIGALDVERRAWSTEILSALHLDRSLFPDAVESAERTGVVSSGPYGGVMVAAGGGDQAAGGVGTGAVRDGVVSVSLGTSGVVFTALTNLPAAPTEQAHTFCHATGRWHAMTVMLSCGGAVRWLRDTFYPGVSYDDITADAARVPAGADGLTFLPYLTGERSPHNDPEATGSLSGLTIRHTRAHVARAVFEGVTFGLLDGLNVLRSMGVSPAELRISGGGAKSAFWRQLLADAMGVPCVTLPSDEGPSYGAALLAGVAAGAWPTIQVACDAVVRVADRVEPNRALGDAYARAYDRYRALYPALRSWGRS